MTGMRWAGLLAGAAVMLTGCQDGMGIERMGGGQATLTFALAPVSASPAMSASAVPIADPAGRVLDIQRVQVVVEEARLKRLNHDSCGDDDACEYFSVEYRLIDLPLESGVVTPFHMPIAPDVYEELELEFDNPGDDPESAAFRAEHPSWPRSATMRIVGSFDANDGAGPQPFDVYIELDAEIEKELVPPLVVDEASDPASVNVTVLVGLEQWFRAPSGLVDPRALSSDNDLLDWFEENLEGSLEAFSDDDRDGRHDDDDDDDDDNDDDNDDDDDRISG